MTRKLEDVVKVESELDKLLLIFNSKENFIKNKEEVYFKVHTIKGLCGLYGFKDLFNELYNFEQKLKVCLQSEMNDIGYEYALNFKSNIQNLMAKCMIKDKNNVYKYQFQKLKVYEFYIPFINYETLNNSLTIISNVSKIIFAKLNEKRILIKAVSTLSIKEFNMILLPLKAQGITLKHGLIKIKNCNFMYNVFESAEYNRDILHLKLLEMCNGISEISKVDFDYKFVSNIKEINSQFYNDYQVPFMEILKNAFIHSNKNKIKLTISIKKKILNNKVVIKIKNNGDKIKNIHKIFDRLYTTSSGNSLSGNGIGLYETKRIVNTHNGIINAKNICKGVMFKIVLVNDYK